MVLAELRCVRFVWTAPRWQGFSLTVVRGWLVQPCVRPVCGTAWPLAIMLSADQVPVKSTHSEDALAQVGCPDPRINRRSHYLAVALPILLARSGSARVHAVCSLGSRYTSPRAMTTQAMRAILLAKATAATFAGRRSSKRQGRCAVPCVSAYRITARAPIVSNVRTCCAQNCIGTRPRRLSDRTSAMGLGRVETLPRRIRW
jgi:hypothetical protein